MFGPLALFNYYTGLFTDGNQFDLLKIFENYENDNFNFTEFRRPIERIGNCGSDDIDDLKLHGYSLVTTKLILNWQRDYPETGKYRFKYNAFIRDGETITKETYYSNEFEIKYK